jgi:hypothetical protein
MMPVVWYDCAVARMSLRGTSVLATSQGKARLTTARLGGQSHASTRELQRDDCVDLDLRAPWKRSDADRDPRWRLLDEERPVGLVDL